jgi:TolA-binding protein
MPREMSKQDIRRNPLAEWVGAVVRMVASHRSLALGLVVAAVVIAGGIGAYRWYEGQQEIQAQQAFAAAEQAMRGEKPGTPLNVDEAAKRLGEVAEKFPRTLTAQQALLLLGNIRFDGGKFDDALAVYNQYLSQFPRGTFRVIAAIGKAYAQEAKGDLQGGVNTLSDVIAAAPNDPLLGEAYSTLARAYESLKKPEDALRIYGQIAEKYPQTQWAQNALQRMAALKAKT